MNAYTTILNVYRSTLKRFPFLHRFVYLVGEKVVELTEHWKHFLTDPTDPLYRRVELLLGLYETGSSRVVKRIVRPGDICLDIGANVGYYTRLISDLIGSSGKVIAFEPHPRVFSLLQKNVGYRPNVYLLPKAASDRVGRIDIYETPLESGGTSIFQSRSSMVPASIEKELYPRARERKRDVYQVETITVDEALTSLGIKQVNFVKMDIEGAEILALRGMVKTLYQSSQVSLLIEYYPDVQVAAGFNRLDMLNELYALSFDRISVISGSSAPIPISEFIGADGMPKITGTVNLLCQKGDLMI